MLRDTFPDTCTEYRRTYDSWTYLVTWYQFEAKEIGEERAFWGVVYRLVDDPTDQDVGLVREWLEHDYKTFLVHFGRLHRVLGNSGTSQGRASSPEPPVLPSSVLYIAKAVATGFDAAGALPGNIRSAPSLAEKPKICSFYTGNSLT